jgi:hypothetical protein
LPHGAGKDSVVSAEILKAANIPFHLFVQRGSKMLRLQRRVINIIGRPVEETQRIFDPAAIRFQEQYPATAASPVVATLAFEAILLAALGKYRYIALSNEQSADIGNVEYLGMEINHQWSKSLEFEMLLRDYVSRFLTPDIIPFSLIRQFSEVEMVRRFARYPKYFRSFSSCNMNFFWPASVVNNVRTGYAFWCNRCSKCIFIFASLTAFLPKEVVVDIFGADLYAHPALLPIFRQLLGIEGFKPFECVGTPEEMMVAMYRASRTGQYAGEPAMDLFESVVLPQAPSFTDMEDRVLSIHSAQTIPEKFAGMLGEELVTGSET